MPPTCPTGSWGAASTANHFLPAPWRSVKRVVPAAIQQYITMSAKVRKSNRPRQPKAAGHQLARGLGYGQRAAKRRGGRGTLLRVISAFVPTTALRCIIVLHEIEGGIVAEAGLGNN